MHGKTVNFRKNWSNQLIKFYVISNPMVLLVFSEKRMREIHQRKLEIPLIS